MEPFPHAVGSAAAFSGMAQMAGGAVSAAVLSLVTLRAPVTQSLGLTVTAVLGLFGALMLRRVCGR